MHVPAIATVGLHDLRGVVYALAGKFGDYSDVLDALNAPFAKWTDKSMPDPEVIGGYMYAWLIISFDNPVDNLTGGYMYAWLIISFRVPALWGTYSLTVAPFAKDAQGVSNYQEETVARSRPER